VPHRIGVRVHLSHLKEAVDRRIGIHGRLDMDSIFIRYGYGKAEAVRIIESRVL
jgi:hypothetical protein